MNESAGGKDSPECQSVVGRGKVQWQDDKSGGAGGRRCEMEVCDRKQAVKKASTMIRANRGCPAVHLATYQTANMWYKKPLLVCQTKHECRYAESAATAAANAPVDNGESL